MSFLGGGLCWHFFTPPPFYGLTLPLWEHPFSWCAPAAPHGTESLRPRGDVCIYRSWPELSRSLSKWLALRSCSMSWRGNHLAQGPSFPQSALPTPSVGALALLWTSYSGYKNNFIPREDQALSTSCRVMRGSWIQLVWGRNLLT